VLTPSQPEQQHAHLVGGQVEQIQVKFLKSDVQVLQGMMSKSVSKFQRVALSPSLSETLAQVQKNFCKHKALVGTWDPNKSHKLLE
jgi:hypothetical protein